MTTQNTKQLSKFSYKRNNYCCLTPLISFQNSFDHQNSTNNDSSTFQYDFATATISSLYPQMQFTNPESLPNLQQSFRRFTASFPQYLTTVEIDQLRNIYFPHISKRSLVCLDYSGHALLTFSQLHQNPDYVTEHENNENNVASTSSESHPRTKPCHFEVSHIVKELSLGESELGFESRIKRRIMKYLNVLEDDYSMFFTVNETSAFRLVGESYPFKSSKNLIVVYDHENEAVEAMVASSKSNGGRVSKAEFKWPKLKIHCKILEDMLVGNGSNNNNNSNNSNGGLKKKKINCNKKGLFVFPIQSKISGARYSYQWMNMARENGWHVLLDATSLGAKDMDTLGLSLFQPDFLICTFYKVFGYDPSGFACLLVRKTNPLVLDQSIFSPSRGVVTLVDVGYRGSSPGINKHMSGQQSEICEVKVGDIEFKALDMVDSLGLVLIGTRTRCLVNWLTNALLALNHPRSDEDVQLIEVYGPRVRFDRGPTLAFNVFDWKGEKVDPFLVQKLGDRNNISLGYGCLNNVWFSERYEIERNKAMDKTRKRGEIRRFEGKRNEKFENEISVVIASVGFLTNFEDVYRVWEFIAKFLDADFVEKERWRYMALNQKTIHV